MCVLSRKYQGRHRALPVSPLQSARVALPALAAASLTVAAAGTAAATDVGQQTRTNASAGFQDTTQWSQSSAGVSRSSQRASVTKAKANVAAKAKTRSASVTQAQASRDNATRRAALGALAANDTSATTYTKPKPKPKPVAQPATDTQNAPTRGSQAQTGSSTSQGTQQSQAPTRSGIPTRSATSTQTAAPQSSSTGWVSPISGGTRTSGFGYRWGRMHSGIDYAAPVGTPLRSMNNGTVTAVGWYGGQGQRVVVRFDNGTEAHYAHMSSFSVSPGSRVSAGQVIGLSGNTGNSTGPHLHLEIHVGGVAINPAGWLAARGLG